MATKIDLYGNLKGVPLGTGVVKSGTPITTNQLIPKQTPVATPQVITPQVVTPQVVTPHVVTPVKDTPVNSTPTKSAPVNNVPATSTPTSANMVSGVDLGTPKSGATPLGQTESPAYGASGTGVVDESGKVVEPPKTGEQTTTTTEQTVLGEASSEIKANELKIAEEERKLAEDRAASVRATQQIEEERLARKAESDRLLREEQNAKLMAISAEQEREVAEYEKKLAELGQSGLSTEQMNASTRMLKLTHDEKMASFVSRSALLSGNLKAAQDSINSYYEGSTSMLNDQFNNYNSLLNITQGNLTRLDSNQEKAIAIKMQVLDAQIKEEREKKETYNAILSSPSYEKAVKSFGLTPSDSVYIQASKIQQAETEDGILEKLIEDYPDAGITMNDSLLSAGNKIKMSPSYKKETLTAGGKVSTTDVLNMATALYNANPYAYGSIANAITDATRLANLVEGGASVDVASNYVTNNAVATPDYVDKQIEDVANKIFSSPDVGSEQIRREKLRMIKEYAENNDYDALQEYITTTALGALSAEDAKIASANLQLTQSFDNVKPLLDKLYNTYGYNGKLVLNTTEKGLNLFGEGTLTPDQEALLKEVNVTLGSTMATYRRGLTGAQFTEAETNMYKSLLPNVENSKALNDATIKGQIGVAKASTNALLSKVIGSSGIALLGNLSGANSLYKSLGGSSIWEGIANSDMVDSAGFNSSYIKTTDKYQCGEYVNKYIQENTNKYGGFGDSLDSKIKTAINMGGTQDIKNHKYSEGDIIIQKFSNITDPNGYGHVAIVKRVNPDGTIILAESNYYGDERVTYSRKLDGKSSSIAAVISDKLIK